MYNSSGRKVWPAELDIYGKVPSSYGSQYVCPLWYPGQYEDGETGLYYNRFRYYDPEDGMYVSQDTIGLVGGMIVHANVPDPNSWVEKEIQEKVKIQMCCLKEVMSNLNSHITSSKVLQKNLVNQIF